ncbi:extracellular solute-binding protein [Marinicrinis lubricantis]|uniref:Extracellular solute-binding protein n=1 Tax=Marinicrinis lubricantis TaxID=2086470 RepID=A0ABW1IQU8_9BACL
MIWTHLYRNSLVICFLIVPLLTACSNPHSNLTNSKVNGTQSHAEEKLNIGIMLPAYYKKSPDEDSPVIKQLEEITNTELNFRFVPSTTYSSALSIAISLDSLPEITVIPGKTVAFIDAVRAGKFWELGPYLKDYPNLSQANSLILNNASIDGKTYGIYRARTLGRMGVSVRRDWMDRLGLDNPQTIDDFYDLLKAFTEQDPDGNGKDDTYGMVVTSYSGPWDIMQVWFGAPNGWGMDENGRLIPAHLTPEYMEALRFFRKIYSEGLVNRNFAVMDPNQWVEPIVRGEAGVIVDVADMAQRVEGKIQRTKAQEQVMDVFGAPEGPYGRRDYSTAGYGGMIAISKSSVKTEEELKQVLAFLDRINDEDAQILLGNGIAGRHYEDMGSYVIPSEDQDVMVELQNLNQLLMFIPEDRTRPVESSGLREKAEQLQVDNEKIIVSDLAEPLVSDEYAEKGEKLDKIINDARTMFIMGQIDEAGLEQATVEWRRSGGDEYIEDINELYSKSLP